MKPLIRLNGVIWLREHGWTPILAFLPLLIAGWLAGVTQPRLQQENQRLRDAMQSARQTQAKPTAQTLDAQRLKAFYSHQSNFHQLPGIVESMLRAADTAKIQIDKADYRVVPWANSDLSVYQISLPVQGSYTAIRHFIDVFLVAEPCVALAEISFKRDAAQTPGVSAKLQFEVFLQGAAQ